MFLKISYLVSFLVGGLWWHNSESWKATPNTSVWLLLKRQIPVLYSEHSQRSKMGALCENNQRLKAVNHFHKKLHLRCLTVFWIRLWIPIQNQQQGHQSNIHGSFVLDFKHIFASSSCHCIIVSSLHHHRKTDPYIFLQTDIAILQYCYS